ncbi:hypothetical protein OA173_04150 [Candidatus Pelagibacter sp.]|nr:hypothetical protein [Candidatus Pelagibacter sp.]
MNKLIKLNNKSKKLLLLQRNELLTKRQNWLRKNFGRLIFTNFFVNYFQIKNIEKITDELFNKEFETFKNYLPKFAGNIMDIGCGLGIIDIYLNEFFEKKPVFFLLDKNRVDRKIKYGFSSNYESYNDLKETKNILLNNNIDSSCINLFDVEKQFLITKKMDLVISLKSMGYHYPINTYIELFRNCCTKNTVFIYDIGENQYDENYLKTIFDDIKIIYEENTNNVLKRVCCKNFKI